MKFLLDTNTCVHILRYGTASPAKSRLDSATPGDVVLCSVVVAALLFGALRSQDVAKNLTQVRTLVAGFRSFDFDAPAAEEYAKVRADLAAKGTPIGPNDLLIAAIALANGLTLVTQHRRVQPGRRADAGRLADLRMFPCQPTTPRGGLSRPSRHTCWLTVTPGEIRPLQPLPGPRFGPRGPVHRQPLVPGCEQGHRHTDREQAPEATL